MFRKKRLWVSRVIGASLVLGVVSVVGMLAYLGSRLLWQDSILSAACGSDPTKEPFGNCLTGFTNDVTFWGIVFGALSLAAIGFGFWQSDETKKREFKAYLRTEFGHVWFVESPEGPDFIRLIVQLLVRNYGRTPGEDFKVDMSLQLRNLDVDLIPPPTRSAIFAQHCHSQVHPGDPNTITVKFNTDLDRHDYSLIQRARLSVDLRMQTSFYDVFGTSYTEFFMQSFRANKNLKLGAPLSPFTEAPVHLKV